MVKVKLELVGELKNHGELVDAGLSPQVKEELKNYIPFGTDFVRPDGFFKISKTSFSTSRLVEGEELNLKFAHRNNFYSGVFKIVETPEVAVEADLPASIIDGVSGGGKRKRKKSRPKRKKSKRKSK